MASINYNEKSTFRQRLVYLCLKDMDDSDVTALMLGGFKGFDNFTEEELMESVKDRYSLWDDHNDEQVYKLTKLIISTNGWGDF